MANEHTHTPAKLKPYALAEFPPGTLVRTTYESYRALIRKWAEGDLQGNIMVIGEPGIGKSETAFTAMAESGAKYNVFKGDATKKGVYNTLKANPELNSLFDDTDQLIENREVTGLLKAVLETKPRKLVQWTTDRTTDDDDERQFYYLGWSLFLANVADFASKQMAPIRSRFTFVHFAPSPTEIHAYVGTWWDMKRHADVYNYIGERMELCPEPGARWYFHAKTFKEAGENWRELVDSIMKPTDSEAVLVKGLWKKHRRDDASVALKALYEDYCAEVKAAGGHPASPQHVSAVVSALKLKVGEKTKRQRNISEAMKAYHARRKAERGTKGKGE